ncbi:hypothetical protein [Pontibacillus yanchengensis]|nr:hypothetical protein [Pontibacillus yanchengensis]
MVIKQESFMKNVRLHFNEQGERWINELPSLLSYCEERWEMRIEEPYHLSINYVAPATMKNNKEVVVKVCIPGVEFHDEVIAISLFQNQRMNALFDFDLNKGIIILEKLTPGYTLAEVGDEQKETLIAARLLKNLHIKVPKECPLHTTKIREENLEELVRKNPSGLGPISAQMFQKAFEIFTYLNQ